MGMSIGGERMKGAKSIFDEIIAENIPNLGKELDIQVRETNRTLYYCNAKRLLRDALY